ncbi:DNA gyrase inhibitor YacG [Roseomonas sp. CCTCC AB2023176]|uniref:DNA gyrase inhibitor YacG n=1 Tax=Roseomonas sp. CCTCC AB2023176 TaxID=3342640 RepID=UPI0035DD952B
MTKAKACPVCGKPAREEARPFCSARCRAVDLGRWLGEGYAIPGDPVAEEEPGRP